MQKTTTALPRKSKQAGNMPALFVRGQADPAFLILVLVILAIGLIMLVSASYASAWYSEGDSFYYIKRQSVFAVIGLCGMFLLSRVNYKYFKVATPLLYGLSIVLLVLVLLIGKGDGVEKRWIYMGFFNLQPSEIAKLAVILMLALYFSANYERLKTFSRGILLPCCIFGLAGGLVLIEPHLSGAVLICGVGFMMMVAAGCHRGWLVVMAICVAVGLVAVALTVPYMQARVATWLDPSSDPQNNGYQLLQSLYAIGSGGLTGQGIGQSRQKYLYVSMPQNDFIFSVVAEELGFVGVVVILGLFAALIYKGFRIALDAPDKFSSLLVFGIMSRLALQVFLNLAVVSNLIPVTGIALPFFSSGGTAMVMQLVEMGLVLSVSRQSRMQKV